MSRHTPSSGVTILLGLQALRVRLSIFSISLEQANPIGRLPASRVALCSFDSLGLQYGEPKGVGGC